MNLYIDSQLEWPEKGLRFRQETRFPEQQGTTLTLAEEPAQLSINLRIPYWAQGGSVKINGTRASGILKSRQLSESQPRLEDRRQD